MECENKEEGKGLSLMWDSFRDANPLTCSFYNFTTILINL